MISIGNSVKKTILVLLLTIGIVAVLLLSWAVFHYIKSKFILLILFQSLKQEIFDDVKSEMVARHQIKEY